MVCAIASTSSLLSATSLARTLCSQNIQRIRLQVSPVEACTNRAVSPGPSAAKLRSCHGGCQQANNTAADAPALLCKRYRSVNTPSLITMLPATWSPALFCKQLMCNNNCRVVLLQATCQALDSTAADFEGLILLSFMVCLVRSCYQT